MEHSFPEFVTGEAIKNLRSKIEFPDDVPFQDWEYIVADSTRLSEFISYYESLELSVEEKFALMIVMVGSYNDAISEGEEQNAAWQKIRYFLINDVMIHWNTIMYWSLLEDEIDLEDCFAVTPQMREIVDDLGSFSIEQGSLHNLILKE
ncbi:hypothetical protein J25TS5_37130 [Paenibacillus faecis]|uniref:hypothetical protein n=1 Tax=Paenibacillus faecis TaxID=862114 RepID=UPI001B1CC9FE|nr:hypothetical protein [Paenibacillus faecis]GIO86781.1 hypothetical protein J25TS5_37130 [Paenibacillus faecis]